MGLLQQASICITPNAVKAGKLYSIAPTDGSGDLTVTRATSATRVDENGLVEIPRTNLTLWSEQFNNSYWLKRNASLLEGFTSPFGTDTAFKFIEDTLVNVEHLFSTPTSYLSGQVYSLSIFVKSSERSVFQFSTDGTPFGGTAQRVSFNLITGVINNISGTATATMTDYGNGWFRCTMTLPPTTVSGTNTLFRFRLMVGNTAIYTGDGVSGLFIYGAQVEIGVSATEYIPTTTVVRTRFSGITQDGSIASNIPRLDYTNGSCPSILVEPQRTNLVFPSATATTQTRTVTATAHTLSFYGTGTVVLTGVATGTLVGTGANNRVTLTFTPTAGNLTLTVNGSVTNWQLEAGSNATSLIPTTTSAVTRNADVISKTGISSLIGQTEGTIFVDYNKILMNDSSKNIISLSDATAQNAIEIWDGVGSGNLGRIIYTYFANNIIKSSGLGQGSVSPSGRYKICVTYTISPSLVNFKFFINGVKIDDRNMTYTAFSNPLDRIGIGNRNSVGVGAGSHNLVYISKTKITDTQAINLTTL